MVFFCDMVIIRGVDDMIYNYKIRVKLKGLEKKIKRTFLVNDNMKINDFCYGVISSMNGDLFHMFMLDYKDKCYLCDELEKDRSNEIKMGTKRLSNLLLSEKDKMQLTYDFGDNWIFNIEVVKVLPGHNEKNISLIDGIGRGIKEDCGGIWSLLNFIDSKDNSWGYDYDDFDINAINNKFDKWLNVKR